MRYKVISISLAVLFFVIIIALMISKLPLATSHYVHDVFATETEVREVPVDTVFEVIPPETATESVETDTSEASPKMDGAIPKTEEAKGYTDEDLLYLAKVIQNEAGSDYCTDEHQRYVASVVLNRVNHGGFPGDTILEIALCGYGDGNPIQYDYSIYGGGVQGFWNIEPSERAIQNARYVLENGVLDDTVIYQANFVQGCEVVKKFTYDFAVPPTTYICR